MGETSAIDFPVFLVLCGVVGMFLLAMGIIVFFVIYQKRLFAQKRDMQKMETAYQKDLLQHSFKAQEAERKRIASDLHDSVGSILSATRLYVQQLDMNLSTEEFQEHKVESAGLIDTAIEQIRDISHNLFPPSLDRLGFLKASQDFCRLVERTSDIDIELRFGEEPPIRKMYKLSLFRILQELITNTLKHAQARKIDICFVHKDFAFEMTYTDDGVGFGGPSSDEYSDGLGIKSIKSRANAMGAEITIQSHPGEGIDFKLTLPRSL